MTPGTSSRRSAKQTRTPLPKKRLTPRRDCYGCGNRIEWRDGTWWHVRASAMDGHAADPRTPLPKKRVLPRTYRCSGCSSRISSRSCPTCGTKKETKRGNIAKRCDTLWSQLIKAPGKCFRCGATEGLQAAHIIGRAQRVTRWDPTNGICLCHRCHRLFDTHRIDREETIVAAIGGLRYANLRLKAQHLWDRQYPLAELTAALKEATSQGK